MYYFRKLSSKANLFKIKQGSSICELDADILKQELATFQNTLSFWKCEDLEKSRDTIKAILLSTTSIDVTQFIILEDSLLKEYGLSTSETTGRTGYCGFEDLHVDFTNLTYEKIGMILNIYREVSNDEKFTPKYNKQEVTKFIKEVIDDEKFNEKNIHDGLLHALKRAKLLQD